MLKFIKSQPVLAAAALAALITVFIVPPDAEYLGYINTAVLIQLFGLMTAVAGLRATGIFERATALLMKKAGNVRITGIILMLLCFFSAMAVTNDVALITFVPLTLLIFEEIDDEKSRILTIVLETAAANLGGMLIPIGNPQNLYLYDEFDLTAADLIRTMLPTGLISLVVLIALSFMLPAAKCEVPEQGETKIMRGKAAAFAALFIICILAVLKIVPNIICLALAVIIALAADKKVLAKVDYPLLVTFLMFFIFVGNIARIEAVRTYFSEVLTGREMLVSALLSQVISNVPAAVMLAGFTESGTELLLGVNIGGFGTMIASLASLISFQFYRKAENASSGKYLLCFSAVNFSMLIFLLLINTFII